MYKSKYLPSFFALSSFSRISTDLNHFTVFRNGKNFTIGKEKMMEYTTILIRLWGIDSVTKDVLIM